MIKDVVDGLKLVSDGIDSVKNIAEAIKSGKDYIKNKHPEIQGDLRAMLGELGKSILLIKRASAVLTNFRFAISADAASRELVRFNNYYIRSKAEAQYLRDHIENLRTHCSKIREYGVNVTGSADRDGFTKLFNWLGLNSPTRERELGEQLDKLAYEDYKVANSAQIMLETLERALKNIQNALGSGGSAFPENVPAAAALLAEYGPEFENMEERAAKAIKDIQDLMKDMQ